MKITYDNYKVSIHAPRTGSDLQRVKKKIKLGSFNPRSRTGSDQGNSPWRWSRPVSIHAPERGATFKVSPHDIKTKVSIHAPERGATIHWAVSPL